MEQKARKEVIAALAEAIAAVRERRDADLHDISNHVLHAIVLYQDKNIVDVAVAIYALDKILETEKYRKRRLMRPFVKEVLQQLGSAKLKLAANDDAGFAAAINGIFETIKKFTKQIRFFIDDLVHYARIKKASKLYEHGLSLGKAAELAGVSKWELMPAIGETATHEQFMVPPEKNLKRAQAAQKLFQRRREKK